MKKKIWISVSIALVVLMLGSGLAMAGGGITGSQKVFGRSFVITVNPPPPPDILVQELTDPILEITQGESIRLAYRITNPVAETRWATVRFFNFSTSGISFDVMLDGNQYIIGNPFVIAPGSSRVIEFTLAPPAGQYPCEVLIDQVPEPPPENG